mmetsp:Transcript_24121/g.59631  ORF Transcript_24121/g.59631 Transcript_24121/m.59631 type:complete len:112 (-) Transcript_24121:434-769(-)
MATERGLVEGMFTGFLICFPVAFVVLLLATTNLYLTTYATFSIACIVCSMLGFIKSAMDGTLVWEKRSAWCSSLASRWTMWCIWGTCTKTRTTTAARRGRSASSSQQSTWA